MLIVSKFNKLDNEFDYNGSHYPTVYIIEPMKAKVQH